MKWRHSCRMELLILSVLTMLLSGILRLSDGFAPKEYKATMAGNMTDNINRFITFLKFVWIRDRGIGCLFHEDSR